MLKHLFLILVRLLFAYVVLQAMAVAHIRFGAHYPGDGQEAFGFVLLFVIVGAVAAFAFFALGCVLQFLMRRRSAVAIFFADLALCGLFAGGLAIAGATASYIQSAPNLAVERPDRV